ncbi:MAG TPA: hypothetical protein V6D22_00560 [Candidatus Obscuribacterales bacterium]
MSSDLQKEMRFGSLLVQLGLISEHDLMEASQLAVELGLPLGKVLVMSDFITDEQLGALVQAQSMLKDQVLEIELAKLAIEIVSRQHIPFAEALGEAGWIEPRVISTNKLGKLLLDARILSELDLKRALENARESGLPLGRVLSVSGQLSEPLLVSCLNAQVLLRDGKINRDQAVKALAAAHARQTSFEQALVEVGEYKAPPRVRIKLGEMFVLAGLLSEETMMDVIEQGLITEEPIGQVLLKGGHVNAHQLEAALKLQEMVDNGSLNPLASAEVLKQICARNMTVLEAVAELQTPKEIPQVQLSLPDLLKLAGVISEEDVLEAFRRSLQNPQIIGRILMMTGFVNEHTLEVALQCQHLIKEGTLREDQALIALNYCSRMNCGLEQAATDLGWGAARKPPVHRKRTDREETPAAAAKEALQFFE